MEAWAEGLNLHTDCACVLEDKISNIFIMAALEIMIPYDAMLLQKAEVDFNITSRTVARLVFEAEQDNRNGGNSSNGR
ncbi:hypothetical protein PAMP_002752 [Pampus punctatissimus]